MSLTPTSPRALRDIFIPYIKSIIPQHEPHRDSRWHELYSREECKGSFRGFFLQFLAGSTVETSGAAIWSTDGASYEAPLRIWTGYRGLADGDDQSILSEDHADLYGVLQFLRGSALAPGLIQAGGDEIPFRTHGPESQGVYGYYEFTIRYLQAYRYTA